MKRIKTKMIVGIAVAACVIVVLAILLIGTRDRAEKGVYGEELDVIQEEGKQTVYDKPVDGKTQEKSENSSSVNGDSAQSPANSSSGQSSTTSGSGQSTSSDSSDQSSTAGDYSQSSGGDGSGQTNTSAPSSGQPTSETQQQDAQNDPSSEQPQSTDDGAEIYHEEFELPEVEI